jgi:hypothetical protein
MYTEPEIRFLLQRHRTETADRSSHPLAEGIDLRQLGCPARLFEKILEQRARKLGPAFAEFRNSQRSISTEAAPSAAELTMLLNAEKLF